MSDRHLLGRLAVLEHRVRAAVAARRAVDADPDDGFRGLYLSDDHVDALLARAARGPLVPDPADALREQVERDAAPDSRLRTLQQSFGLSDLDVDLLLAAAYPDLDAAVEKLYGYLHDDVTQRRATTGLALELAGCSVVDGAARARFSGGSPLVQGGLLTVDPDAPFLRRVLRVPDRVVGHLLGDDDVAGPLRELLHDVGALSPTPASTALGRLLTAPEVLVHLRTGAASDGPRTARAALRAAGRDAVCLDLERLPDDVDGVRRLARSAGREARLRGAGLVAWPLERLVGLGPRAVRAFAELPCPTLLLGACAWDPAWSHRVAVHVDAPALLPEQRAGVWREALDGALDQGVDAASATAPFRLDVAQVQRAAASARQQAELAGRPVGHDEIVVGARSQNAVGLERLARRTEPSVGWDDLVLPDATLRQLQQLTARARHRDTVLDSWRMRPGSGRGRGIAALFAGESGTGKTMSAEVVAGALGLHLYTVDLATVVDKYIGETEKNLEKVFGEADGVNGVLLFDEADALFGKRSDVKDARDRYANVEVAYLLQRMESFNGLAILSTNLQNNLDEAFARRLDAIVDFAAPDAVARRRLWDLCLGSRMPRADDLDLDFLADRFELSGGNIRSVALTAAYASAASGRPVRMADLVDGVQQEYRKLGRLLLETEFGRWLDPGRRQSGAA